MQLLHLNIVTLAALGEPVNLHCQHCHPVKHCKRWLVGWLDSAVASSLKTPSHHATAQTTEISNSSLGRNHFTFQKFPDAQN